MIAKLVAFSLALLFVVSACAGGTASADGIVLDIDSQGLGQTSAFTLRTADGETLEFTIAGPVDVERGGFPPAHLREHMALAESITVAYEVRDGKRVVTRLADAP